MTEALPRRCTRHFNGGGSPHRANALPRQRDPPSRRDYFFRREENRECDAMKWTLDGSRRCARCDRYLRPEAFAPNPKMADGLHSWCRSCVVANTRKWRAANGKVLNARKRAAYRENRVAINERV